MPVCHVRDTGRRKNPWLQTTCEPAISDQTDSAIRAASTVFKHSARTNRLLTCNWSIKRPTKAKSAIAVLGERLADGRWQLAGGFHRVRAARLEGRKSIEARRLIDWRPQEGGAGGRAATVAGAVARALGRLLGRCVAVSSELCMLVLNDGGPAMKAEQVSVPLPANLHAHVRRQAEREDRSVASVIRRLVAAAAQADPPERARER
jgi:hypothetical protein